MRHRGACILIEEMKIALIKRVRNGLVYYVFPGGGIENDETPEQAAIREAYEELGVRIRVNECFQKVHYSGTQFYFIAEILEGQFGNGQGEEFTDSTRNRGSYEAVWIEINDLLSLDIRPLEVAEKIYSFYSIKNLDI